MEKLIDGDGGTAAEKTHVLTALGLSADTTYSIARTSITLEDFTPLAACERELKEIGWIKTDHDLAPALTAANLETIFDILSDDFVSIHYLSHRSAIQKQFAIMADELDLLGFYLETGFCVDNLRRSEVSNLNITGASAAIDNYYNSLDAGIPATKPTMKLPKLWWSILRQVRGKTFPGWTDATNALLSCGSPPELRRFAPAFEKIMDRIPHGTKNPAHKFTGIIMPPHANATAIMLFAYRTPNRLGRENAAMKLAEQVLSRPYIARCQLFGFDVERQYERLDRVGLIGRNVTRN